jgi:tetratricopeptide (TPR) repeat protein
MTVPVTTFSSVALHWLHGLLLLARGDDDGAIAAFDRELALESSGHLYARECCANTWYAIGALHLRRDDRDRARAAFHQALNRVAQHRLAQLGLRALAGSPNDSFPVAGTATTVDASVAIAAALVLAGRHADAAGLVDGALAGARPGNTGWLLPIEPLLHVTAHDGIWAPALARLRARAS